MQALTGKLLSDLLKIQTQRFVFFASIIATAIVAGTFSGCAKTGSLSELTGTTAGTTTTVAVTSTGGGGSTITEFSKLSGDFQSATLGSPASLPLKVVLLTSAGIPDVGKSVFFTVVGGASYGITSATTATTGADGIAQVTFTAGTTTGAIAITAATAGQTSQTFTVTVNAVSVYAIAKASTSNGNSQTGNVGASLASPFKVVVTDTTTSSVVPNVTVRFLANQGAVSGSFSGATYVDILTDSNGIATSSTMSLNTTSGSHTIRAYLLGDSGIFTDFTATAVAPSGSTVDPVLSALTLSAASVTADGTSSITATLRVKDQYGNLIPNGTQTIATTTTPTTTSNNIGSLAIWDSGSWTYASAGTYTRTFSVNTEVGTITFDTVTVSGVALTSTMPTCGLFASGTIDPTKSAISTSTGSLTANGVTTATIIVTLNDYFNNQVSATGHAVIISTDRGTLLSTTLTYHSGSGTYRTFFTTPTSTGSGSALFTLVSVDGTAVVGKTASITLVPGAMTSIAFTSQPAPTSNDAVTAFTTQPVITTYDANSNVLTTDSASTVTLTAYDTAACAGSVVASGLSGTATKTLISGVGTFTNITAIKPSVRSIKATLGALTACSSTLTISLGAIDSIAFTTSVAPTATDTDAGFTTQPVVTAYDASSNVITTDSSSNVVLTAYDAASCGGSVVASGLSGTATVTLSAGVSTFTNVKVVKTNVRSIKATLGAKTVCSSTLTISPGAFSSFSFSTAVAPTTTDTDAGFSTQPVVSVIDANSNAITGTTPANVVLSAYDAASCGGSVVASGLSGTTTIMLSSGVATFTDVKAVKTSVRSIKATFGANTACSSTLTISPGAISTIAFSTQPAPTSRDVDTGFTTQPIVTAYDANSNIVTNNSSATITLTATTSATCSAGTITSGISATTNPVTLSAGVATFAAVRVERVTAVRIQASDGTHTACSDALTISAGAVSAFTISDFYPTSLIANGTATSTITANAKDQFGVNISGVSVTLASSRGATDTIATSPATSDSSGNATFTVKSSTTGNPTLTLTSGAATWTRKLLFLSQTPTVDYQARYAKAGSAAGDTATTSSWKDIYQSATTNDFSLNNFLTPNTAWAGSGGSTLATDPYRLTFASASSQYLKSTTALNSGSDAYMETWIRPSSSSTKGSVILSNGNSSNKGFVIKQSAADAGKVEVKLGSSNTYVEEVMADSPVLYWRLGELSGTTVKNLGSCLGTPSNCDGTMTNNPTLNQTHTGDLWADPDKAVLFTSASSQYITNVTTNLTGAAPTEETFEFWVKPTNLNSQGLFQDASVASSGNPKRYFHLNSDGKVRAYTCDVAYTAYSTTALSAGTWYYIVWTRSAGIEKIYINGSPTPEVTSSITASCALTKAWLGNAFAGYASATIDEFAIYNTALSPTRIAAHYAARVRPVCRTTSTLTDSAWSFISSFYDSATGNFSLFMNGTQECTQALASPTALYTGSNSPLATGAQVDSTNAVTAGTYWSGDVGEIRASNTIVTNANVVDHYNAESGNYPAFTPSSISGLTLWFAADDLSTLFKQSNCTSAVTTDGDTVACWTNKASGAHNITQGTTAQQPVYAASSINSKPGVKFGSGATYNVLLSDSFAMYNRTYFIVSKINGTYKGLYHSLISQTNSPWYMLYGTTTWSFWYGGADYLSTATPTGNQLHSFVSTNSSYSYRVNASTIKSAGMALTTLTDTFQIGGFTTGAGLNGDIDEILVYNVPLTETEIKRVEAYLNAKYKLY